MTVTTLKKKLEQLELEGHGDIVVDIQIKQHDKCGIKEVRAQGSGIVSSVESVVIVPEAMLWFA
jgi:hypothetical protein